MRYLEFAEYEDYNEAFSQGGALIRLSLNWSVWHSFIIVKSQAIDWLEKYCAGPEYL